MHAQPNIDQPTITGSPKTDSPPSVGIIMGSQSDLPVMQAAADILDQFSIAYELRIVSAHRTPHQMVEYATQAVDHGLKVIIAGAGGAAHLPGMVASITPLPVIGVPVATTKLNGLDSLASIVQMPAGVPVATVAINGAQNAGILAAQILATSDPAVRRLISQHKKHLEQKVCDQAVSLAQSSASAHPSSDASDQ
jgi:5-(carboxyamino)imidazole ribonucleotide mutase